QHNTCCYLYRLRKRQKVVADRVDTHRFLINNNAPLANNQRSVERDSEKIEARLSGHATCWSPHRRPPERPAARTSQTRRLHSVAQAAATRDAARSAHHHSARH